MTLRVVIALLALAPALVPAADVVLGTDRFEIRSAARVNLHHFLLAWAAADNAAWPPYATTIAERESWRALLDDEEQREWGAAVGAYAATVRRDPLFDRGLILLRDWAAGAGSPDAVAAPDRLLIGALETALPIYERYWWPAHDAQNRAWIASLGGLLERVENEMAQRVEAAYGGRWPTAPVPVDVVAYAHPLGAYSTAGRVTIGSIDNEYRMPQSLEMLFHEASHVESLESPLRASIDAAFRAVERDTPGALWHDMIFFTSGTITQIVFAQRGQPGYRHYGQLGVYRRAPRWESQLPILERYWRPFLESGSVDASDRASALEAVANGLP